MYIIKYKIEIVLLTLLLDTFPPMLKLITPVAFICTAFPIGMVKKPESVKSEKQNGTE